MVVPAEHHLGHFGPPPFFLNIDNGDSTFLSINFLSFEFCTFSSPFDFFLHWFLSRKREIIEKQLYFPEFWSVVDPEPIMEKSLVVRRHNIWFLLCSQSLLNHPQKSIFSVQKSILFFKSSHKGMALPSLPLVWRLGKVEWTETGNVYRDPNSTLYSPTF